MQNNQKKRPDDRPTVIPHTRTHAYTYIQVQIQTHARTPASPGVVGDIEDSSVRHAFFRKPHRILSVGEVKMNVSKCKVSTHKELAAWLVSATALSFSSSLPPSHTQPPTHSPAPSQALDPCPSASGTTARPSSPQARSSPTRTGGV